MSTPQPTPPGASAEAALPEYGAAYAKTLQGTASPLESFIANWEPETLHGCDQWRKQLDSIVAPLLARVAELEKDKARLDKLEAHKRCLMCLSDDHRGVHWTAEFENQVWTECDSARSAIDALPALAACAAVGLKGESK